MCFANQVEKKIIGRINSIKNAKTKEEGSKLIAEYKVNSMLERLKPLNEVAFEELSTKYLNVVKNNTYKPMQKETNYSY